MTCANIDQSEPCILNIDQSQVLASSVLAAVSGFYHPYAAIGHVYGLKSAPCVNAANVPVPCAGHFYGKRSADAEAGVYAAVPFGDPSGLDPITQGADPVTQVMMERNTVIRKSELGNFRDSPTPMLATSVTPPTPTPMASVRLRLMPRLVFFIR